MTALGSELNIGVVGYGARARTVLKHLLPQDERLRIRGVFDIDPAAVDRARSELGQPNIQAYPNLEALVSDASIDWVVIGSWNVHHIEAAVAALDAGKHVFCEKPLATTFADCMRFRDAAKRAKGMFSFGLVLRYSPHYQRVHQMLIEGKIGELISFEFNETLRPGHGGYIFGNWRRRTENAGSHMLEKCCHDLDLANWMTGSLPIRVASFGGRRYFTPKNAALGDEMGRDDEGRTIYEEWPDLNRVHPFSGDADVLDHQVVILEYQNGVCATFHTNAVSMLPERRFYLMGTRGSLHADAYDGVINYRPLGRETASEDHSIPTSPDGHGGGDSVMAAGLAASMLEGRNPLAGIDQAVESAVVALAIDEAQSTGKVVDLSSCWAKSKSRPVAHSTPR